MRHLRRFGYGLITTVATLSLVAGLEYVTDHKWLGYIVIPLIIAVVIYLIGAWAEWARAKP